MLGSSKTESHLIIPRPLCKVRGEEEERKRAAEKSLHSSFDWSGISSSNNSPKDIQGQLSRSSPQRSIKVCLPQLLLLAAFSLFSHGRHQPSLRKESKSLTAFSVMWATRRKTQKAQHTVVQSPIFHYSFAFQTSNKVPVNSNQSCRKFISCDQVF